MQRQKPHCGFSSKASEMELINQTTFQTRHKYREPTHTASVVPELFRGFLHPLIFVWQVHSANHDQTLQSLRKNIQFPYEAERSKATRQAACLYVPLHLAKHPVTMTCEVEPESALSSAGKSDNNDCCRWHVLREKNSCIPKKTTMSKFCRINLMQSLRTISQVMRKECT